MDEPMQSYNAIDDYIKANPTCTRRDVIDATGVSTQRLGQILKAMGVVLPASPARLGYLPELEPSVLAYMQDMWSANYPAQIIIHAVYELFGGRQITMTQFRQYMRHLPRKASIKRHTMPRRGIRHPSFISALTFQCIEGNTTDPVRAAILQILPDIHRRIKSVDIGASSWLNEEKKLGLSRHILREFAELVSTKL